MEGKLESSEGVFENYLKEDPKTGKMHVVGKDAGGKLAITRWRTEGDEVVVQLETGRKNQIRVQFAHAGHPIVGDEKYGAQKADRLYLHATQLKVKLRSGEWRTFSS
ncbi:MAG: RNA pseudouridine synthase [Kiritimatiellae bacterium]|nr:RNA pseudouridine synthase [Kiritimatiellia bacterium]